MLTILFLLVFIIAGVPFILGFFNRGSEWLMRPSMYLNMYLLFLANQGSKVKDWIISKF